MSSAPLWRKLAVTLHADVLAGRCHVVDIAMSILARIKEREPSVHAWAWSDPKQVMAAARAADILPAHGPLAGVAIGIKDVIETADMPTSYGASMYKGHRPRSDAALVSRLRAAGALLVGKTVTTEFAYSAAGPTRNPDQLLHTPGGSSSGSAAAVAAGMVPVAISSQTGGSIIRPAAYCGVVGFKPTHGIIDTTGMKALAPSCDTVGLHARSVSDIELVFSVLSALAAPSSPVATSMRALRIAWFPGPHESDASDDARACLHATRAALEMRGSIFAAPSLPLGDTASLSDINRLMMAYEGAQSLRREYAEHRTELAPETLRLIEEGRAVSVRSYDDAVACAARYSRMFEASMKGFDLLMTYSAPSAAPLASVGLGNSVFNRAWSTLGVPCLHLPCERNAAGLALGVQLVTLRGQDRQLLRSGRLVESALSYLDRTGLCRN